MTTDEAKKLADAMLKEASALVAQATQLGREHRLDLTFTFEGGKDFEYDEVALTFDLKSSWAEDDEVACWEPGGWVGSSYRC